MENPGIPIWDELIGVQSENHNYTKPFKPVLP
jgi:hypothetical protein